MSRRTALRIPVVAALVMASFTATTPAPAEPDVLHVPGEVHFAMTADGGQVLHTIRRGDGTWHPLRFVPGVPTVRYSHSVNSVIVNGEEHMLYYYVYGNGPKTSLRYVIRRADGSWVDAAGPGDVEPTSGFALAEVAGELHRVRRVSAGDGPLEHVVRHADGTWSSPSTVPVRSTFDDEFTIAGSDGALRLLVNNVGLHTAFSSFVRHADGRWEQTPDVPFDPPTGTRAVTVVIAQVGAELHAVVTGGDGGVYHAVQRSTGDWTTFHDIASQTGAPGGTVTGAAITASRGALHLVVNTGEGRILHTIRSGDGRWLPFGDVLEATGSPNLTTSWLTIAGS